jgi:hypothetical protein
LRVRIKKKQSKENWSTSSGLPAIHVASGFPRFGNTSCTFSASRLDMPATQERKHQIFLEQARSKRRNNGKKEWQKLLQKMGWVSEQTPC